MLSAYHGPDSVLVLYVLRGRHEYPHPTDEETEAGPRSHSLQVVSWDGARDGWLWCSSSQRPLKLGPGHRWTLGPLGRLQFTTILALVNENPQPGLGAQTHIQADVRKLEAPLAEGWVMSAELNPPFSGTLLGWPLGLCSYGLPL